MYRTFDKDREFQMRSIFLQLFILSVNLWVHDFNWYDRMNEWMQSGWNELSMQCWCGIQQFEPKVFNYLMTNRLSLTSISSAWNFDYKKEIIIRNVASVAPLDITYICSPFLCRSVLNFYDFFFFNFFLNLALARARWLCEQNYTLGAKSSNYYNSLLSQHRAIRGNFSPR